MKEINELLRQRKDDLNKVIHKCRQFLAKAPKGTLRAVMIRGRARYYYRSHKTDRNGKYLNSTKRALAERLARRDYYSAALDAALKELGAIDALLIVRTVCLYEDCFDKLTKARKLLLEPLTETDADYAKRWQEEPYEGKAFYMTDPDYRGPKGERMRSKSEVIIANILYSLGIPYKYECPLYFENGKVVYPDFTILNVRTREVIIFEHLGMLGDEEYARNAINKINALILSGYIPGRNLILSYESNTASLNVEAVKALLKVLAM